jgi:hypothetical protein
MVVVVTTGVAHLELEYVRLAGVKEKVKVE